MKSNRLNIFIGIVTGMLIGFVCGVTFVNAEVAARTGEKAAGDVIFISRGDTPTTGQTETETTVKPKKHARDTNFAVKPAETFTLTGMIWDSFTETFSSWNQ